MDQIIDDIQSGIGFNKDITANELIIVVRTKYNNKVEGKTWGKVDLCNCKDFGAYNKAWVVGKVWHYQVSFCVERHLVEERNSILWKNGIKHLMTIQSKLMAALTGGARTIKPRTMMVFMCPRTPQSITMHGPMTRRTALESTAWLLLSMLLILSQRQKLPSWLLALMTVFATILWWIFVSPPKILTKSSKPHIRKTNGTGTEGDSKSRTLHNYSTLGIVLHGPTLCYSWSATWNHPTHCIISLLQSQQCHLNGLDYDCMDLLDDQTLDQMALPWGVDHSTMHSICNSLIESSILLVYLSFIGMVDCLHLRDMEWPWCVPLSYIFQNQGWVYEFLPHATPPLDHQ